MVWSRKRDWLVCPPAKIPGLLAGAVRQLRFPIEDAPQWDAPPRPLSQDPTVWHTRDSLDLPEDTIGSRVCPYGAPGTVLHLRESIRYTPENGFAYAADGAAVDPEHVVLLKKRNYSPAILPEAVFRARFKVTEIRVQQMQDATEDDIKAEGGQPVMVDSGGVTPWGEGIDVPDYHGPWMEAWDAAYEKRGFGWSKKLWTWVVLVERIEVK